MAAEFGATFQKKYSDFFALEELENTPVLVVAVLAVLLGMALAFYGGFPTGWGAINMDNPGSFICPNFLQDCEKYIFFRTGAGYFSQRVFFSFGLLGPLVLAAVFAYKRKWVWLHLVLMYLVAAKIYLGFIADSNVSVPFMMFNLVPAFVLLFSRRKLTDLRWCFLLLYFMAGFVKLDEGWIVGSFFSTTHEGLRLFPQFAIPLATNLVILFELFGVWFLFHKNAKIRYVILTFFIIFHLYSTIYVSFRYPLLTLPLLVTLFGGSVPATGSRISRVGVVLTTLLLFVNLLPFIAGPNHKWTHEAKQFSLDMFDGNRQALSRSETKFKDGHVVVNEIPHTNAYDRAKPYNNWYHLKKSCNNPDVVGVAWTFTVSVNGGPFRRIIQEEDVCKTEFHPFSHNEWIHLDGPIVGYPINNYYVGPGELQQLTPFKIYDTVQIHLSPLAQFNQDHLQTIKLIYAVLALLSFCMMASYRGRERFGLRL